MAYKQRTILIDRPAIICEGGARAGRCYFKDDFEALRSISAQFGTEFDYVPTKRMMHHPTAEGAPLCQVWITSDPALLKPWRRGELTPAGQLVDGSQPREVFDAILGGGTNGCTYDEIEFLIGRPIKGLDGYVRALLLSGSIHFAGGPGQKKYVAAVAIEQPVQGQF